MSARPPTIYVIAGCNGAGKATFAREFLPKEVKCLRFLKADEIARGLSPFKPSAGAVQAARLLLAQVEACLSDRETFALENTLSGKPTSGCSSGPANSGMRLNCIISGSPVRLRQLPGCASASSRVATTSLPLTSAAGSSAAGSICLTIISR